MPIGQRTAYLTTADQTVTASTALVPLAGLTSPIAAGQTQVFRAVIPFTAPAAGGVKVQVVVPATGTAFVASILLANTVAPAVVVAQQLTSAAFADAIANAGNHYIIIEGTVVNGAVAGSLEIQVAQNSAANATVFKRGASLDIIKL